MRKSSKLASRQSLTRHVRHLDSLERRTHMDADPGVYVNLLGDVDRNGVIDARDNRIEGGWTTGAGGRGIVVLPNLDRDNTTTNAPDNWTGGVFNGRAVAPNNLIDNAADLADVGRFTLKKLKTDASYEYTVVIRVLKPASDPAYFTDVNAADRIRIFMPSKSTKAGDTVPQAGDVAVIGPGLASEIRFAPNPTNANDYPITDIVGTGDFTFGIEGLKPGANVRIEAELIYQPIGTDGPPPDAVSVGTDVIQLKVAPFVLNDNRQRVTNAIVDDLTPYSIDNSGLQNAMKDVFGKSLTVGKSGDLWQQDGYEIGYVQAPYGAMPVVLELPRSRDFFFSTTDNMRKLVRGTLLKAGVGVSLDVVSLPTGDSSSYGGDIETVFTPGSNKPGRLLISNMPAALKSYFAAQGVNAPLDLPLDWMAVNHVDEVVQQTPDGKVIVADPDIAWASLVWAQRIDPNVRLQPKMNGNEYIDGYNDAGIKASVMLADARLRAQALVQAQQPNSLRGVVDKLKKSLGVKDELTAPTKTAGNGTIDLARGGAFTQLIGTDVVREFSIRFDDATNYRLRYRDDGGAWSKWQAGRTDRDEIFADARAFILKDYWTGTAAAGDAFKFRTRPDATLLKMPVLFATSGLLADPNYTPPDPKLVAFTEDHVNALVDGNTVITGNAYGPKVKWSKAPAADLLQTYAGRVFNEGGYTNVVYADARAYHDSSGSIHCGTNAIRTTPDADWWLA